MPRPERRDHRRLNQSRECRSQLARIVWIRQRDPTVQTFSQSGLILCKCGQFWSATCGFQVARHLKSYDAGRRSPAGGDRGACSSTTLRYASRTGENGRNSSAGSPMGESGPERHGRHLSFAKRSFRVIRTPAVPLMCPNSTSSYRFSPLTTRCQLWRS
jgi:hypothetical protein